MQSVYRSDAMCAIVHNSSNSSRVLLQHGRLWSSAADSCMFLTPELTQHAIYEGPSAEKIHN